ncbi:hypothetical protein FB451DRAFT_1404694 [Mycena latifolia]|nr:hypothetical protein FB451DRAFT_1404694 [Mycena latifolia]
MPGLCLLPSRAAHSAAEEAACRALSRGASARSAARARRAVIPPVLASKMAILAQAAAILAAPPLPHPLFAAMPALAASVHPPVVAVASPPGRHYAPVVRSKAPRPSRSNAPHAPLLVQINTDMYFFSQQNMSPYASLLAEHGVKSKLRYDVFEGTFSRFSFSVVVTGDHLAQNIYSTT